MARRSVTGGMRRDTAQPDRPSARFLVALVAAGLSLLVAACAKDADRVTSQNESTTTKATQEEVLAVVGGVPIEADQLRRAMVIRGGDLPGRFDTLEEKEALLQELIKTEALAQLGREAGYGDAPEIRMTIRQMLADLYLQKQLQEPAVVPEPTPEEIRAYYDSHGSEFVIPGRARGSLILFRKPPDATATQLAEVRARADAALSQLRGAASPAGPFADLAKRVSGDLNTRENGGDMGWVPKNGVNYKWDPAILDSLFGLSNVGDLSDVGETSRGYYLILLTGSVNSGSQPLEEVSGKIRHALTSGRMRQLNEQKISGLTKGIEVRINRELLAEVGPQTRETASDDRPPSFPLGSAER